MKYIAPKELHGKTIKRIDTTANCWTFHFKDGSRAVIDTETKVSCSAGTISGPVIIELTDPDPK